MTVLLNIPTELEAQFVAAAEARGVPVSEYLQDFIVEHYREDVEQRAFPSDEESYHLPEAARRALDALENLGELRKA